MYRLMLAQYPLPLAALLRLALEFDLLYHYHNFYQHPNFSSVALKELPENHVRIVTGDQGINTTLKERQ